MQIGAIYPHFEFMGNGAEVLEYARHAEALGYDFVGADDHVAGPNPARPEGYSGWTYYNTEFLEPFVLFAAMSAVTERLEFCSTVLILPQRQTVLAAKQAATLDVLSGGRLRLGIGVGWSQYEYQSLGMPFHERGARVEEQIELMRRLWREEHVCFKGRWEDVPDMGISPHPPRKTIPLWFGGQSDPVIRRVARIGDGWMPLYRRPEEAQAGLALLRQHLSEAGRDLSELGLEARISYGKGDAGEWRALADGWRAMGATHLSLVATGCGLSGPAEHMRALDAFREALACVR